MFTQLLHGAAAQRMPLFASHPVLRDFLEVPHVLAHVSDEDCCFDTSSSGCRRDSRCCNDPALAYWRGGIDCHDCNGDGCSCFSCSAFTTWYCPPGNYHYAGPTVSCCFTCENKPGECCLRPPGPLDCYGVDRQDPRCCTDPVLAPVRQPISCSNCNGGGCSAGECSAFTTWNCPSGFRFAGPYSSCVGGLCSSKPGECCLAAPPPPPPTPPPAPPPLNVVASMLQGCLDSCALTTWEPLQRVPAPEGKCDPNPNPTPAEVVYCPAGTTLLPPSGGANDEPVNNGAGYIACVAPGDGYICPARTDGVLQPDMCQIDPACADVYVPLAPSPFH